MRRWRDTICLASGCRYFNLLSPLYLSLEKQGLSCLSQSEIINCTADNIVTYLVIAQLVERWTVEVFSLDKVIHRSLVRFRFARFLQKNLFPTDSFSSRYWKALDRNSHLSDFVTNATVIHVRTTRPHMDAYVIVAKTVFRNLDCRNPR